EITAQYEKSDTINSEPAMRNLLTKVGALGDLNSREQEELKLAKAYMVKVNEGVSTIEQSLRKRQMTDAHSYYEREMKGLFDALEKVPDVLMELQLEQAKYANEEGVHFASDLSTRIVTTILVSIVLVGTTVFFLSKRIVSPLRNIAV